MSDKANSTAQWVLERLLALRGGRFSKEIAFRLLRRMRVLLIERGGDPLVHFKLGAADLLLPISHELPFTLRRAPTYSQNIGRVAAAIQTKHKRSISVDIGSNIGDTLAILRQHSDAPVLCVEGHPRFAAIWEQNAARNPTIFANAKLAQRLIGGDTQEIEAEFVSMKGTAHLDLESNEPKEKLRLSTLEELFHDYPDFAAIKLLKIDTDGMDTQIILGNIGLIRRLKPAVFFEFSPPVGPIAGSEHFRALIALKGAGYRNLLVWEELGEYSYSLDLAELSRVEELVSFYSGRTDKRYADVCAFHNDDSDLASQVRTGELRLREPARIPEKERVP